VSAPRLHQEIYIIFLVWSIDIDTKVLKVVLDMIQSYKMVSGYPERTGNGFIGWLQPFAPGAPS
jgi:hypothetical protein